MNERIRRFLTPPRDGSPAQMLRWIRRIAALAPLIAVLALAPGAADGTIPVWLAIAAPLLMATSPFLLTGTLRAADRREAETGYERPRRSELRRRALRVALVQIPILVVIALVVGYLMGGLVIALVLAGFSGAAGVAGVLVSGRLYR